jgi:NADP-dependent 3-hydroxy acid dehydrogenase YdfG
MNKTAAPPVGQAALVTGATAAGAARPPGASRAGAAVALLARSATDLAAAADTLTADGH